MAPQLGILQAFQLVREHLVVFVFADAQPFASSQQYIIAAEAGNEAGIDQIGFVNVPIRIKRQFFWRIKSSTTSSFW